MLSRVLPDQQKTRPPLARTNYFLESRRAFSIISKKAPFGFNVGDNAGASIQPEPTPTGSKTTAKLSSTASTFTELWDFGKPTCICQHCGALHWYEERTEKTKRPKSPKFSTCCLEGRVQLPLLREPQVLLKRLLDYQGGKKAKKFKKLIRMYNSAFCFTSLGGKIDKSVNVGGGPYTFRLNGQNLHLIGSLLPDDGERVSFAQLYIHDTQNEVSNRIRALSREEDDTHLDENIVRGLMQMLDEYNVLVQSFRLARDSLQANNHVELKLCLIGTRTTDGREYNLPSCSEVAALVVGDSIEGDLKRDIIVNHKRDGLQRISSLHPSFMGLQYPLLFPHGEDGYRLDIMHKNPENGRVYKKKKVSMRQFYAYRLQQRTNEGQTILRSGRLFQQYVVDAYSCIEEIRLNWIRDHQTILRAELYTGLKDAFKETDVMTDQIGRLTVIPSTHTGGPRYRQQNYHDAMAICRSVRYPDIFLTFTCNPKWPEISDFIEDIEGQKGEDRIDVANRVFSIKLWELLHDIKRCEIFGKTVGVIYTIEFQKSGLPHAHILVFLSREYKVVTTLQTDLLVSAEIPDKELDPDGYSVVERFMVHRPCGVLNSKSPCMINGVCSKHYPKRYHDTTTTDADGYPNYKRSNNGVSIKKKDISYDNRYIVPYNRNLIVKYDAHINIELCNRSRSIKYLFKYVNKGPDRVRALVENASHSGRNNGIDNNRMDEVKMYLDCRHISASEACWKIFDFDMFHREPAVERLSFHLPGEHTVYFNESSSIDDVLNRPGIDRTMFTEWMKANASHPEARCLTYVQFPTKFVWNNHDKIWTKRKNDNSVGRIYYTPPNSGEKYYLRMLLNLVRGCCSYDDIKTVDGVTYPTFKEACYALGLLDNDKEWADCLEEASLTGSGPQLRQLFCTILMHCEVVDPGQLWENNWQLLSEDILHLQRRILSFPQLNLTPAQLQNYTLLDLEIYPAENRKILRRLPWDGHS